MKVMIEEIRSIDETEVYIKCKSRDELVERIVAQIKLLDIKIIGKINDRIYRVAPYEIYYFESVDNKVFAYSENIVLETNYKLYELENLLPDASFMRVNKNTILNISKIQSFGASINGRMNARLKNHEEVVVSRTYMFALKKLLGGLKK